MRIIKHILKKLCLLKAARAVVYWSTRFDSRSKHPRRVAVRFYSQFIRRNDLCFDIGAHIGNRTRFFLALGAKVICVEPQKSCLDELNRYFGANKYVTIIPKGIADKEGVLELSICESESRISTMSDRFKYESRFARQYGCDWKRVENVPVITLDMLISQYGVPDFCKIDVEGFEERALRGLTKAIPLISFEFNAELFDDVKKCIKRLLSIGPYRFNYSIAEPTDSKELLLPLWVKPEELYERLEAVKEEDPQSWGDIYAKCFQ